MYPLRTAVPVRHSAIPEVQAVLVLHALDKAERELARRAALQGLELATEVQEVGRELAVLDYRTDGTPYIRPLSGMSHDEQADWCVQHLQPLPGDHLILTFAANAAAAAFQIAA